MFGNRAETESTLGCPVRSISLKHIRLRFHESYRIWLPENANQLFVDLQKVLQKNWKDCIYRDISLQDTGLDFTKKTQASMRLITETRPLRITYEDDDVELLPENRFAQALQEFIMKNQNPVGSVLEIYRNYFFQQANCNLTSSRHDNALRQQLIIRRDGLPVFNSQIDFVDISRNNLRVATLNLVFNFQMEGESLIPILDEDNSSLINMLVEYQWRFVKVLHVGSIDIDGTLIHGGTDQSHDTPQKIIEANDDIVAWARQHKISKFLSGSNRQSIIRENANRASRAKHSLYSGSSILLLEELAKTVNAEFDGLLMSDASNHVPPGTHCHYMYTEEIERGKREAPENFVGPLADEYKIVLMRLQAQHLANLYKDNPNLSIVLHFLDDMPNIIKTLTSFYQHHQTIFPKKFSLQIWQREASSPVVKNITICGDMIKGLGLCDPNYLGSILYMQNFSKEGYFNHLYESIRREIDIDGSLNNRIATSINSELLEQPPLGLELTYISAEGELAIYKPSNAAFEISEKGPAGYNASGYNLFCLRLQLRNRLIQNGFAPENIDLNIDRTEVVSWNVLKERFYYASSAMLVVEKISKIVAHTFGLDEAKTCIALHKQNGFFASHAIFIDFNLILNKLLSLQVVEDVGLTDAVEKFSKNFW